MVDDRLRTFLARDLTRLAEGRMPVSDMDETFFFRYSSTDDRGVREIAALFYSLFSSQCHRPTSGSSYDHDAAPGTVRCCEVASESTDQMLQMAILFLRSQHEYRWSDDQSTPGWPAITGVFSFVLIPLFMGFAFFALPSTVSTSAWFMLLYSLIGVTIMFTALLLVFLPGKQPRRFGGKFGGVHGGDCAAWPFFSHHDLDRAA